MKTFTFIILSLISLSCIEKVDTPIAKINTSEIIDIDTTQIPVGLNEVMLEKDILFNGKLNRFFTLREFENVFGKADSTILMSVEEPCSYIFDNKDGSKDMKDKYLYKDGSRFENSKKKVAVDDFRFENNNFITYKGRNLNASTTLNDLKEIFPNAVKAIGTMDVYGEGELQVIQLREDENNISDGHINVFIKNGKLFSIHWWFPC